MQQQQDISSISLAQLGIVGFEHLEPLILTSIITQSPLLLIGASGTGKTFLLNQISKALQLEHRHYNASLLSFDDLLGFPFPNEEKTQVEFLPTKASIWGAESLLVDEISRCRPEIQNKFFSLIHERKIQGIPLPKLTHRWAAMNPFDSTAVLEDHYDGSEPLDAALADRFHFLLEVPDWSDLSKAAQSQILSGWPEQVNLRAMDAFRYFVQEASEAYQLHPPSLGVKGREYVRLMANILADAGYRISPRRAVMMSHNIAAHDWLLPRMGREPSEHEWRTIIRWSLPHRGWKGSIPNHIVDTAHTQVMQLLKGNSEEECWLNEFLYETNNAKRVALLDNDQIDQDIKSLAVIEVLYKTSYEEAAILAFTLWPMAMETGLFSADALNELAKIAQPIFDIEGELQWRSPISDQSSFHPDWSACLQVINRLSGARKDRTQQLFLHLLVKGLSITHPQTLEGELSSTFNAVQDLFKKMLQYV